jgi:2-polyprenyl-3-methyl-5-hydroxy-6-metoxy-1,4-benzoquinol methylase
MNGQQFDDRAKAGTTTAFWDSVYLSGGATAVERTDAIAVSALRHFGNVRGKRLLDIGFGRGEFSLLFAQLGADVTAVETSSVATERLSVLCKERGLSNVTVLEASATETLKAAQFDFVFGNMVLHHIEPFADFALALRASLSPAGKAFFSENNAAISRLAIWFRQHLAGRLWFPKYGDTEEFPLTPEEVDLLRSHLRVVVEHPELRYFRLISLYVFRDRIFPRMFAFLDEQGFKIPKLRKYSYLQYLFLERASGASADPDGAPFEDLSMNKG